MADDAPRTEKPSLSTTIWSVWGWFVFGATALVMFPIMVVLRLVTLPFDRGNYWAGYLFRKLPVVHSTLNPLWTFRKSGVMPANPRNPYVVVSNHESFADILLISHLPWEMKWMSKAENFKLPVVGWMMHLAGDIRLVRGDRGSGVEAIEAAKGVLAKRVSVMIFPEGTRSKDGELLPFKDGAFRLAIETGTPILPLAVHGTKSAIRKHDWRYGRSTAEVRVHEPVPVEGLTLEDLPRLKEQVRSQIQASVAAMGGVPVVSLVRSEEERAEEPSTEEPSTEAPTA